MESNWTGFAVMIALGLWLLMWPLSFLRIVSWIRSKSSADTRTPNPNLVRVAAVVWLLLVIALEIGARTGVINANR